MNIILTYYLFILVVGTLQIIVGPDYITGYLDSPYELYYSISRLSFTILIIVFWITKKVPMMIWTIFIESLLNLYNLFYPSISVLIATLKNNLPLSNIYLFIKSNFFFHVWNLLLMAISLAIIIYLGKKYIKITTHKKYNKSQEWDAKNNSAFFPPLR